MRFLPRRHVATDRLWVRFKNQDETLIGDKPEYIQGEGSRATWTTPDGQEVIVAVWEKGVLTIQPKMVFLTVGKGLRPVGEQMALLQMNGPAQFVVARSEKKRKKDKIPIKVPKVRAK